jgi:hypothetical protein
LAALAIDFRGIGYVSVSPGSPEIIHRSAE